MTITSGNKTKQNTDMEKMKISKTERVCKNCRYFDERCGNYGFEVGEDDVACGFFKPVRKALYCVDCCHFFAVTVEDGVLHGSCDLRSNINDIPGDSSICSDFNRYSNNF